MFLVIKHQYMNIKICCGGTIIAIIITLPLKKSGMLGRMKESLEE